MLIVAQGVLVIVLLRLSTSSPWREGLLFNKEKNATECPAIIVNRRPQAFKDEFGWDEKHSSISKCVIKLIHLNEPGKSLPIEIPGTNSYTVSGDFTFQGVFSTELARKISERYGNVLLVFLDSDEILRTPEGKRMKMNDLKRLEIESYKWATSKAKLTTLDMYTEHESWENDIGKNDLCLPIPHNRYTKVMARASDIVEVTPGHHGVKTINNNSTRPTNYFKSDFKLINLSPGRSLASYTMYIKEQLEVKKKIPLNSNCSGIAEKFCEKLEALQSKNISKVSELHTRFRSGAPHRANIGRVDYCISEEQ